MKQFKPCYYISNYQKISIERLHKEGIRLLLCDIDNTLVASHDPDANASVRQFVKRMEVANIHVAIVSNARKSRVMRFSKDLNIPEVYYLSLKPLTRNLKKAMAYHHCLPRQTALLGDQLFTDMWAGNHAGVYTILTQPISQKDKGWTKVNRKIEGFVFKRLEKKYGLKKGDFDD